MSGLYPNGKVRLAIKQGESAEYVDVDFDTALGIAVELLMITGHHGLALQAHAKTSAGEAGRKLQERRNSLVKDLSGDELLRYEHIRSSLRKAIDRIIELEDGQANR